MSQSLVTDKEESFVFLDGAADRPAEVTDLERHLGNSLLVVRKGVGIESFIPPPAKDRAMVLIRAALGDDSNVPCPRPIEAS